ncbi:hypothetical protein SGLAM104S_06521 [Streptomyces glaucescens]
MPVRSGTEAAGMWSSSAATGWPWVIRVRRTVCTGSSGPVSRAAATAAGGTAVVQSTACQASSPGAPGQACCSVPTATPTRGGATVVPTPRRR